MIPLCLVTGFLGAGKTSLLKHIARTHKERRIVYLVNEFSPDDIDGALVSTESDSVVTVPGGSIFCKCLVTEFIGVLKSLPDRYPDIEGVVIEASGMANPKVIQIMLDETGLSSAYRLARIVSVVDPSTFLKLQHTLPNIVAQVESADMVLINKADCCDARSLAETRAAVLNANSRVRIEPCEYGVSSFDLFPPSLERELSGEYAQCQDPNYSTATVQMEVASMDELQDRLTEDDQVYRAKGSVLVNGVKTGVEFSGSGLVAAPVLDDAPGLVMITRGR